MIVNLRIKANKLQLNGSSRKKLNPFCQLTRIESTGTYNCENEKHVGIGRTETISNCQHPYWFRNFEVEFELGDELYIIFDVYHEEDEMERKLIGSSTFEIGNILGHKLNRSVKLLQNSNGKNDGLISVMIERYEKPAVTVDKALMLKLSVNLQKKHRVFYELERQLENDSWQPIYRTEYDNNMEKVMTKVWDECEIPYSSLTSSSIDEDENTNKVTPEDPTLRIKIMSYSPKKGHTVIGYAMINVNSLSQSFEEEVTLELENKNNNDIGQVKVMYIFIIGDDTNDNNNREIDDQIDNAYERRSDDEAINSQYVVALPVPPEPSFVDYITGDCSMNLYIAIDFTSSNGDPRQPSSPHYLDPYGQLNDYENAIFSIGEIVAKYDTDQKFPVWGFGAKFQGIVRHAFELGGKAEVSGINGVLEAYRGIFQSGLVMSSPTVLTEVIEIAASQATHSFQQAAVNGGQAYGILLILSNGNDSDINKTKETLKRVANAPLSVIIVGIGNNDFSGMHHLDNFHEVEGGRDLCNFVEFEKYRNEHISVLRSATLNEIPSQLSSYFHMRGIMPSSKVMHDDI